MLENPAQSRGQNYQKQPEDKYIGCVRGNTKNKAKIYYFKQKHLFHPLFISLQEAFSLSRLPAGSNPFRFAVPSQLLFSPPYGRLPKPAQYRAAGETPDLRFSRFSE